MADKEFDIQVIVAGPQDGIKAHGSRIIVQGLGVHTQILIAPHDLVELFLL